MSGVTPEAVCSSGVSCSCVVDAGWMTSVFASPTLAKCEASLTLSMNFMPASRPPLIPNVSTAPKLPSRKYSHGVLVERVRLEARVRHPAHLRVLFQVLRQSHSVRAVAFHAERQSLQAEDEVERSERVLAHAEIAQAFDAATHDERRVGTQDAIRAERVPELQSVVARRRISHHRVLTVVPVHRTAVDDDAADGGAVAADPLRRGFQPRYPHRA